MFISISPIYNYNYNNKYESPEYLVSINLKYKNLTYKYLKQMHTCKHIIYRNTR